jgi:hypothetical protein
MPKTLVVETNAGNLQVQAPSFMAVQITPDFISRLKELRDLPDYYDLTEVRCEVDLKTEEIDGDTLVLPELVVTSGQFWFTGELRNAEDECVRSHSISTIDWNYVVQRLSAPDDDDLMVVAGTDEDAAQLRQAYLEKLADGEIA